MVAIPLLFILMAGQTAAPDAKPAAKPTRPSDFKAFSEANGIKDPETKIEAFEKFLKEYPGSQMAESAARQIITETVDHFPKDRKRILTTTDRLARTAKGSKKATLYNSLAWQLYEAGLYPKDAEKYAKKSVAAWKFPTYAAEHRASANASKRKEPDEAALRKGFAEERAASVDTLGQIYAKQGKAAKAEPLLKEVLAADPSQADAATTLADLAEKAGRLDEAKEWLTQAVLIRPTAPRKKRMREFWAKTHNGSEGGLAAYLDEQYEKRFPNPVHPKPYEKTAKRTNRVVLAEVHTGAGCPPCVAADLAFDVEMERYARADLAVIMYHQHIPRPDPLTNNDTRERWKWQEGRGVPTYVIDGKKDGGGGARRDAQKLVDKIDKLIAPELERPAGARITLTGSRDGRIVHVKAAVGDVQSDSPEVMLRIALLEKSIHYAGENGIRLHPMVVRSLATYKLEGAKAKSVGQTFDVEEVQKKLKEHLDAFELKDERHKKDGKFRFAERPEHMDEKNLAVVAFVQDEKSKEVLQAAYLDLAEAVKVSLK